MERRSSTTVKIWSGHIFKNRDSFLLAVLPTKRPVTERIRHLKNFRILNAAKDIVEQICDRWVWCDVYPVHHYINQKKNLQFRGFF